MPLGEECPPVVHADDAIIREAELYNTRYDVGDKAR